MAVTKNYNVLNLLIVLFLIYCPFSLHAENNKSLQEYSKKPDLIIYEIINNGADKVVHDLISDQQIWFDVLKNISGGSEEWIRVAVFLREGTDAGSTSELCDAVNDALRASTKNVLSIAIPVFQIWEICSATPLNTYELTINKIEEQIISLKKIKEPMLYPIAQACIKELEKKRLPIKQYFEVDVVE